MLKYSINPITSPNCLYGHGILGCNALYFGKCPTFQEKYQLFLRRKNKPSENRIYERGN
jgi:hypothetical protein